MQRTLRASSESSTESCGNSKTRKMNVDMAETPAAKKRRLANHNESIVSQARGTESSDPLKQKQRTSITPVAKEPGNALLGDGALQGKGAEDLKGLQQESKAVKVEDDDSDKLDERLTFPERLMYLLQHEVEPKALWWQKDGASFGFEPKLFTAKVLNKLFPTKIKFESFIRKLNRWGFRRVPGQALPPNGAAYKHPYFKKSDPDLMKSMKFGQKVDSRRLSQPLPADPTSAGMLADSGHLLAGRQSTPMALATMHGAQTAQQLALMRALATSNAQQQTLSQLSPRDLLANQALAATGQGLAGFGSDVNDIFRNRLLLGGLPATLPSLPLAGAGFQTGNGTPLPQQLQGLTNIRGRRVSALNEGALSAVLSSERDLRNSLLLGSTAAASVQRRLSQSGIADPTGPAPAALAALSSGVRPVGSGASIASAQLDARIPLGSSSASGISNLGPVASTGLPSSQFADSLNLLHMRRVSASSQDAELLMLLEQERQRKRTN